MIRPPLLSIRPNKTHHGVTCLILIRYFNSPADNGESVAARRGGAPDAGRSSEGNCRPMALEDWTFVQWRNETFAGRLAMNSLK